MILENYKKHIDYTIKDYIIFSILYKKVLLVNSYSAQK